MDRVYNIKPIPTEFNGVKYKSRLEARWAVFFHTLGIEAFYEYEGYQLPTGWYVPDFYVPSMNKWFEIKPNEPTQHERDLCLELSIATQKGVVFLTGDVVYRRIEEEQGFEVDGDVYYYFCECPVCGKIGLEFDGRGARVCGQKCLPGNDKGYSSDSYRLMEAFSYASKYQFNSLATFL